MQRRLPETMIVIEIAEPGGPEVLRPASRPLPKPAAGEVLIKVGAAGVNRPDVMQRKGLYPPPAGASDLPGLEVAGTVAALGEEVTTLKEGDAVCALVTGGGYAEYCTAAQGCCLPIPKGLNEAAAAALPETFFTVWSNVFDRGGLKAGERFLIHGGAGGIGTTAIQLAHAFGAEVFATAGSKEKCRACAELGAHHAINYRDEDFVERIGALTGGRGVDLILDMIGGDYFPRNLKALAVEGRLVIIAVQKGPETAANLLPIMLKRLTVTGSTLRPRCAAFKSRIAENLKKHVWPLLESGRVKPVVHGAFPLARASDAHRLMEGYGHIGKIVLTL